LEEWRVVVVVECQQVKAASQAISVLLLGLSKDLAGKVARYEVQSFLKVTRVSRQLDFVIGTKTGASGEGQGGNDFLRAWALTGGFRLGRESSIRQNHAESFAPLGVSNVSPVTADTRSWTYAGS
jgi:hypothetical protein